MDSKDAPESLESGGGARCRCSNRRRTAAVFVIQSLVTAACAALSLYIFISHQQQQFSPDSGIFMQMLNSDSDSDLDELKFMVHWNQKVDLNDEKKVKLSCAGPYMVYLWACVNSYGTDTAVNLTLEQEEKLFHLQTLRGGGCQEMQSVFMLSNKTEVTLKVTHIKDTFTIDKLFLGLHYMLGAQCFDYPL